MAPYRRGSGNSLTGRSTLLRGDVLPSHAARQKGRQHRHQKAHKERDCPFSARMPDQHASAVVDGGRFYYQNGVESTVIVSVSATGMEMTVENSTTISSSEHYRIEYALDDTPATVDAFIVMEAFTLDPTTEVVRPDIIFNGVGDVNHAFTRGEDSDGLGTYLSLIHI